jgi:hypothetical protein
MPSIRPRPVAKLLAWRRWREARRQGVDDELRDQFVRRALEVRDQVLFLLAGGLSEGAEEALAAIAEQDMLDFDLLVDLSAGVPIDGVPPLPDGVRSALEVFLGREPWRSLAIDHDITVVLAMIETVAFDPQRRPWYESAPHLYRVLAEVMDRVNGEQCARVIGEFAARQSEDGFQLPADTARHIDEVLRSGAARVGARPPDAPVR